MRSSGNIFSGLGRHLCLLNPRDEDVHQEHQHQVQRLLMPVQSNIGTTGLQRDWLLLQQHQTLLLPLLQSLPLDQRRVKLSAWFLQVQQVPQVSRECPHRCSRCHLRKSHDFSRILRPQQELLASPMTLWRPNQPQHQLHQRLIAYFKSAWSNLQLNIPQHRLMPAQKMLRWQRFPTPSRRCPQLHTNRLLRVLAPRPKLLLRERLRWKRARQPRILGVSGSTRGTQDIRSAAQVGKEEIGKWFAFSSLSRKWLRSNPLSPSKRRLRRGAEP